MKKLVLLGALALAPILAQSQYSNFPAVVPFPGVPSGACAQSQLAVNTANGNLYSCSSASWTAVGTSLPDLTDSAGVSLTSTVPLLFPSSTTVAGLAVTGAATTGLAIDTTGRFWFVSAGVRKVVVDNNGQAVTLGSGFSLGFSSNADPGIAGQDTSLVRDAASTLAVKNAPTPNTDMKFRVYGINGAFVEYGAASELLTLSTGGTTTDTTANLLPANSIIDAVDARVTTTITTATDWKLGDATTAGRFPAANATMTSGTTQVGTVQADQTSAAGPRQVAAAKVRVTTTGTPGAGVIRITVHYHSFTPPTS